VEAERRLQVGERALFQLIQACDMLPIDAPPWVIAQIANINTPDEWQRFTSQQAAKLQQQQQQQ
jgi:hypothetical protein